MEEVKKLQNLVGGWRIAPNMGKLTAKGKARVLGRGQRIAAFVITLPIVLDRALIMRFHAD